jgi:hypothetical protein
MSTRSIVALAVVALAAVPAFAGSKAQMNLIPRTPDCSIDGFCLNSGDACPDSSANAACAPATVSPKSKVKLDGKLQLKGTIKGVTTIAGAPLTTGPADTATDNLILKVGLRLCPLDTGDLSQCASTQSVYVKVVLTGGLAKLNVSLAPVFASLPVGSPVVMTGLTLFTPVPFPGPCLGGNASADLIARLNDPSCEASQVVRALGGVVTQE